MIASAGIQGAAAAIAAPAINKELPMPTRDAVLTLPAQAAGASCARNNDRRREMRLWLVFLLLANFALLLGNGPASSLMYNPAAVVAGEWWRVCTWPWVHVSHYHLLLDGAAFLLLYQGLEAASPARRLSYVLAAAMGSLLLPVLCSPEIGQLGLCGLSGLAHGLMAISALELYGHQQHKRLGAWLLIGLLAKTSWELWSGTAFLQHWHFGDIGQPIVTTHAGGVLGGLLIFGFWEWFKKKGVIKDKILVATGKSC